MENQSQILTETLFNPFSNEIERVINTTNSQLEIWTDCIFGGDDANKAYNLSVSIIFKGNLEIDKLEQAVNTLVKRHECLRATFSPDGQFMCIYSDGSAEISQNDISNLSTTEKELSKETLIKEELNFLFDLVNGPLFNVSLIKLEDFEYILTLTHHHIIGDGLSFDVILEELGTLYSAYVENVVPHLPNPERFSEFAEKMNSLSQSNEYKHLEDFWLNIYKESVPTIELPIDYIRPSIRKYNSHRLDFPLDDAILNALKNVGLNAGCSLVTTLLAAFEVFLYKLTGQNDLVVGFPYSGNMLLDMRQMIGHCVNSLPLRSKINPNCSFSDYLKQRNTQLFDAYEHQQVSFGHLLKSLAISRDPSRIPLIPVILTVDLNRDIESEFSFEGLTHEFKINPREYATFEIQLHVFRTKNGPSFQWSYNTTLFKPETITKMMKSFEEILQKIVEDPSKTLQQITFKDYLYKNFEISGPKMSYPKSTLHELFAKQAEISPNSIALEFEKKQISYRELSRMINQMANYLWSQGLEPGQIVAVSLERTPELIASIYAILQCGAIYLPLDTSYPENRIQNIILDSEASFYISRSSMVLPPNIKFINIEIFLKEINNFKSAPLKVKITPESIAYIIYTSGSTGQPKGVKVSHRNVVNFVYAMKNNMRINEKDKFLSVTSISFDPMVFDVFVSLLTGASVVFTPRELVRDGNLLLEKIVDKKITIIAGTPSLWQIILDSGWENQLNLKALTGGEVLHKSLANSLLSRCNELWNLYGPTETTVASLISKVSSDNNIVTIGKPIDNTFVFLVDNNKRPVKNEEIGEIAIGGDGVSSGYLNRRELTEERFIENTFSDNTLNKLYLTGDLAKLLPDGNLQYIGRLDQQVKIRGHRIELGEIEQALLTIEGIKSAVVIVKTDILLAFIETNNEIIQEREQIQLWRNELASQLPAFMIPHEFYILEKLPTTLNGKIDGKALLNYKSNKSIEYTEPRTEAEKIVATIWKESLNKDKIDVFSNFFEIGGYSLIAVRVMNKIEKQTGKKLHLSALFEHSTIEKFAKLLETSDEISSDCLVPIKSQGNKVPLFIIHGAGLNVLNFMNLSKHFDEDQPIYGFQGIGPNGYENWYQSIEGMAAHYIEAIKKINPNGPYALAGFSFGGVVAFEMTRQLMEQGKTVSLTGLLDSYVDSSYYYASLSRKKLIRYYDINHRRWDYLMEMLTSWKSFKMRINAKKEHLLRIYFGKKDTMTEHEVLALEQFIKANRMVQKIVDCYHLKPQNFEVDLFRAKDDESYKLDTMYLGWKKAALEGITIHNIPGDHLDILAPPNDKVLARMLQKILDERHANI